MKVVYLTWGETPRGYGVFGSQVIKQFSETKKKMPTSEFHFLSGVPLIHSGMTREKFGYIDELKKVKKMLSGISFGMIPIFTLQTTVNSNKNNFKFNHGFSHYLLMRKLKRINPDVVHCRSYHAAWAANQVREKYSFNYKVVFDARGLWPEETAMKLSYSLDSEDYAFLKQVERYNLSHSDVVVSVSGTMAKIYEDMGVDSSRNKTVFLSANTSILSDGMAPISKSIESDTVTFGYVGALSDKTWHKTSELFALYKHIRNLVKKPKLVIVTNSPKKEIEDFFSIFPAGEVVITETKSVDELKVELKKMDIGLMSYFNPETDVKIKLASTVLAVKSAEYLSAGVPILVNRYCGGVAKLVMDNNIGRDFDINNVESISQQDIQFLLNKSVREQAITFSRSNFDYVANAEKYAVMYTELVENNGEIK